MNRRVFVTGLGAVLAAPRAAEARAARMAVAPIGGLGHSDTIAKAHRWRPGTRRT
jgi:hypothetical protein